MQVLTQTKTKSRDVHNLTFSSPDLSSFCQLNKLSLVDTGQRLCERLAVIECRFTKAPEPCPKCGAFGVSRGSVGRHLAHAPYGQRPTNLLLRIRRWSCFCGWFWHEDSTSAASPRSKLSYGAIRWALAAIGLDPFHVVRWASNMLDDCLRRVQQETLDRRGHKNDPFYKYRRTLLTRISYLSDANKKQLARLFSDECHLEVDCSWSMYQRVVAAYNEPDRRRGKMLMQELIQIITAPTSR